MSRGRKYGSGGRYPVLTGRPYQPSLLDDISSVIGGVASYIKRTLSSPSPSTYKPRPSITRPYEVTFVISDTHFSHERIRKYAKRPYRTTYGMNKSMVIKWNQSIFSQDTVYFLGDFAWSHIGYYITHLNGHKIFIRGNHDDKLHGTKKSAVVEYEDYTFLLIHNPEWITDWNGWVIHGHVHNKKPFIDLPRKRINVSVEMIGYRPVSLHRIVQTIRAMEKIDCRVARDRKHAAEIRRMA